MKKTGILPAAVITAAIFLMLLTGCPDEELPPYIKITAVNVFADSSPINENGYIYLRGAPVTLTASAQAIAAATGTVTDSKARFSWSYVAGADIVSFSQTSGSTTTVTELEEGIAKIKLEASNYSCTEKTEFYLVVNPEEVGDWAFNIFYGSKEVFDSLDFFPDESKPINLSATDNGVTYTWVSSDTDVIVII